MIFRRLLRSLAAAAVLLAAGGCIVSHAPLLTAANSETPFGPEVTVRRPADGQTFKYVRSGSVYVTADDNGHVAKVRFHAIATALPGRLYIVQAVERDDVLYGFAFRPDGDPSVLWTEGDYGCGAVSPDLARKIGLHERKGGDCVVRSLKGLEAFFGDAALQQAFLRQIGHAPTDQSGPIRYDIQ